MDITIERNVMLRNVRGTYITSERNVQGQTLQVRGMYSGRRIHVRGIGDRHWAPTRLKTPSSDSLCFSEVT